jgi:dethiobiotin synthetase
VSALFVTGTGTDIGKTFVAAGLIRQLRREGRSVDALKPVASGFDPAAPVGSDAGALLAALGRPVNLQEVERISPWRYRAPLSPDLAAAREGRAIDFAAVVELCRTRAAAADVLVVEGVGGVMVPLDGTHTVLDWMAQLRIPVLVVAGSYLGTLSHTFTTVDVLARRNLAVPAIVVSESAHSPVPLDDTVAVVARFVHPMVVIGLPRLPAADADHPAFAEIARAIG